VPTPVPERSRLHTRMDRAACRGHCGAFFSKPRCLWETHSPQSRPVVGSPLSALYPQPDVAAGRHPNQCGHAPQ